MVACCSVFLICISLVEATSDFNYDGIVDVQDLYIVGKDYSTYGIENLRNIVEDYGTAGVMATPEYGVYIDWTLDHDQPSEYPETLPVLEDMRQSGPFWVRGEGIANVADTKTFWDAMKPRGISVLPICPQYVLDVKISIDEYIARVTSLVNLCPDLPAFEIGQEPEQTWWSGGPLTPQEYMQMLTQVVPIIKNANPNALIIGPAVSCWSGGVTFLQNIKNLGAFDYFDRISLHYYIYWGHSYLDQCKAIIGNAKPIWITEAGWNQAWQGGGTESAQNIYLQDYLNPTSGYLKADSSIEKVFYFCLNDAEYPVTSVDEGWGLTYGPDRNYMTKQAYATFKQYIAATSPLLLSVDSTPIQGIPFTLESV